MKTVVSETSKVVVLTGASSGIGEATARHLSRKGHHLFIGARRIEKLTALATELWARGVMLMPWQLTSRDQKICNASQPGRWRSTDALTFS